MRLVKVIPVCFLFILFVAFDKKENTLFNLTSFASWDDDTNKHTICQPPSRSVSLIRGSSKINAVAGNNKEMALIPGGKFQMGSADFADSKPVHTVTVNSFWMDEHEVTNAQFAAFVEAQQVILRWRSEN